MERIVIGRDREGLERLGDKGTVFIGRHIVGRGEEAHLANPVHMDVIHPHIVLVCGKRGSGKSYTSAVIAEEIHSLPGEIRENLSVLMIDTMGIYWSMKMPNTRDTAALSQWGMRPRGIKTKLFVPKGFVEDYEKLGIDVDFPLTIPCSEITAEEWSSTFGFSPIDAHGIAIDRAIKALKAERSAGYSISDIIGKVGADKSSDSSVRASLINKFEAAEGWGLFERKGTPTRELFEAGMISVVDVSHYMNVSASWSIKNMLVGLLARRIFQERLVAKKSEEFEFIGGDRKKTVPMVWIMIDEAHQFLPKDADTVASDPLLTLIKQGREPGISLLIITQRPDKLHSDALSQSDIVISHRLTSQADLEALRSIMQTYMLEDIEEYINTLPRTKGAAIVLDDNSERIYAVQIRPRVSWHAGGSPEAVRP